MAVGSIHGNEQWKEYRNQRPINYDTSEDEWDQLSIESGPLNPYPSDTEV